MPASRMLMDESSNCMLARSEDTQPSRVLAALILCCCDVCVRVDGNWCLLIVGKQLQRPCIGRQDSRRRKHWEGLQRRSSDSKPHTITVHRRPFPSVHSNPHLSKWLVSSARSSPPPSVRRCANRAHLSKPERDRIADSLDIARPMAPFYVAGSFLTRQTAIIFLPIGSLTILCSIQAPSSSTASTRSPLLSPTVSLPVLYPSSKTRQLHAMKWFLRQKKTTR